MTTETATIEAALTTTNETAEVSPAAETQIVEAAPAVVAEASKKGRGRPAFNEAQKAFKAAIWTHLVFGSTKAAARKTLKDLRDEYASDPEKLAVLNSANRSIEMRGRKHAAKVEVSAEQPVTVEVQKVEQTQESVEAKEQKVADILASLDAQTLAVETA